MRTGWLEIILLHKLNALRQLLRGLISVTPLFQSIKRPSLMYVLMRVKVHGNALTTFFCGAVFCVPVIERNSRSSTGKCF